uniref:Uncharacterized protein n=1 Tax=Arundo donax TaxID=35708 RepID=A0A0A9FTG8_ARUDO
MARRERRRPTKMRWSGERLWGLAMKRRARGTRKRS